MNIKKIVFALSAVSVMTLTSCGGSGIRHTVSKFNPVYHADLNHDGRIAPFELDGQTVEEDNLTWIEAYDTLVKEANSMADLNEIADKLEIANDEPKRTSLARYEILHQAEELLMSTGAIVPIYNYGDPYLLKPEIGGACDMDLGYKFFDRLKDSKNPSHKDFIVSVGTKAESFDPAVNSDVSTTLAMNQFLIGAKRYVMGEKREGYDKRQPIFEAILDDGVCTVTKQLVVGNETSNDDPGVIAINECPDLVDAIAHGEKAEDYIGTARYTITLKDGAVWNDNTPITSDDFIYAWTRASCGVYNGQAFGVWCNMFDMIRGYNAWTTIGQQKYYSDPSKWSENDKKKWEALSEIEQNQYNEVVNGYSNAAGNVEGLGCAGGMAGIIKDSDTQFTVQLINDCDYFEPILASMMFMPVAKEKIILRPSGETEKTAICKEDGDWWLNKDGSYLTNGPLQINGKIDNTDGGGIKLKKAEHATPGVIVNSGAYPTINSLEFKFIDKDSTIYAAYKSGAVDLINQFPSSVIDDASKTPDWCVAQQIGLFFYDFNVNDNTFDIRRGMSEREREKLRTAAMLLVNRDDIAVNVAKKGCTAANGFVSTGVIESCIPSDTKVGGKYVAQRDNDGNLITADWHSRNTDTYADLKFGEDYSYKDHIMGNRNNQGDGFVPIVGTRGMSEEEVMKENTDKAIRLAEEVGVHYDKSTGKFTNFPRINIATNNGSGLEDIAERMQAYYGLWGIDVTITTQEWQSFTATRRIGDFACARQGWVADYSDPRTYLDLCCSDSGNNDTQLGKDSWHWSH